MQVLGKANMLVIRDRWKNRCHQRRVPRCWKEQQEKREFPEMRQALQKGQVEIKWKRGPTFDVWGLRMDVLFKQNMEDRMG